MKIILLFLVYSITLFLGNILLVCLPMLLTYPQDFSADWLFGFFIFSPLILFGFLSVFYAGWTFSKILYHSNSSCRFLCFFILIVSYYFTECCDQMLMPGGILFVLSPLFMFFPFLLSFNIYINSILIVLSMLGFLLGYIFQKRKLDKSNKLDKR